MKNPAHLRILLLALLMAPVPQGLQAAPAAAGTNLQAPGAALEYKVISGYKQPFNDDLKYQISQGWNPVGGVSVTVWNGDLYFAQLLGRPAGQ